MIEKAESTRPKKSAKKNAQRSTGLRIDSYFAKGGRDPFDDVEWELRTTSITGEDGKVHFEQKDVEVPKSWSQTATNIVAQKYFRGVLGTPERETSVRQLISRVADTITGWGQAQNYFATPADATYFRNDLKHLLVHQKMAFNSPVWFNVGVETQPQCSACFINSVEDTMESILTLVKTEGMLFKWGSGTGSNLSPLRSSKENLSKGGIASGPVSFMKGFDAFAGVIKSGGKTRRAAKMVILNVDHPDIEEFITCKAKEERKAHALIDAGYDGAFTGEAYASVFFQNSNNSVRVTDDFMKAVEEDGQWTTHSVKRGDDVETIPARKLWQMIAQAAYDCGDPGLQFDTTINNWHTSPVSGRINASNPCLRRGTRLLTESGWRTVESLAESGVAMVFDGVGFVEGKIWKTGVKPIVRIHTNNGRSVDLTGNHQIYTSKGWLAAAESDGKQVPYLLPSEHLDGESQLPKCITGADGTYYSHCSQELMEVLGFLQGDGGMNASSRVVTLYHTPDKDGQFIHETALPLLSNVAAEKGELGYAPSELTEASGHRFSRQRLWTWLVALGFQAKPLPERLLPSFVWAAKRNAQCAFLRGLFGANGTVCRDARRAVVLVSTCRAMLSEVQLLLQGMGIASAVRIHNKAQLVEWENGTYESKESYHLEMTHQEDISRFARTIGFVQMSQTEKLVEICDASVPSATVSVESKRLRMTVVKVEDLGIEDEVYDFSAPSTNIGVANGIVVHNCSEYMFLDNSACNLASLNLRKFQDVDGELDAESLVRAVDITILAQEIVVDNSKYPTEKITENSHAFRPLGLGYANLGALLMSRGLPYDSDPGRAYAAAITALMHGRANHMSAVIARDVTGPCEGYMPNREPFLAVMKKHRQATEAIDGGFVPFNLMEAVHQVWEDAIFVGEEYGFRNAQVTVLAPTGTIGFMMDCDTTGIEPDIALVKYKRLVGGGMIKIVNQTVPEALDKLGYSTSEKGTILKYIDANDTIEGAHVLKDEHLPVFDCAFRPKSGKRSINHMGHIKMMAATQPFLSGAISKTVNLPNECSIEDVKESYMAAWKMGLKAIAIYRDGCKRSQPVSTSAKSNSDGTIPTFALTMPAPTVTPVAVRRKLAEERESVTHHFSVGGHDGYLTVGKYDDGTPGELFLRMAKEGSTIGGLMDSFATVTSLALQHGVPLPLLVEKLTNTKFDPAGWTGNQKIPRASSVIDYIFKWMKQKFITAAPVAVETATHPATQTVNLLSANGAANGSSDGVSWRMEMDAPTCHLCGGIMVRNGSCHRCLQCGETSGCS